MKPRKEEDSERVEETQEAEELGIPVWTEGAIPPPSSDLEDWNEAIPALRESSDDGDRPDGADPVIEIDYDVVGGENFPPHEHRFVGERCEVCGGVRRYGRAA